MSLLKVNRYKTPSLIDLSPLFPSLDNRRKVSLLIIYLIGAKKQASAFCPSGLSQPSFHILAQ